eukprot:TRINITY_DN6315_c0_g1_i7.p1 TRINITY_DN6315_c0_g1~~TRINITY_DN6315_c0_g1_i7.p1  ORF type:complete len:302 (-),score=27.87 TRINITY_DN6315_c0_g1_i7:134-1039(-)
MSEPQRPPDDPSYFKRAVAQTRCNDARKEGASLSMSDPRYPPAALTRHNDACKEGASPSMSDPRYPPDDDPSYFKRAVVHGMIRCLYYDQQDALEQLIPQRDEARAVDDQQQAHALSSEIEWREQLMDACIPYLKVKQDEVRLLANASTEWLLKQIPYVDIPVGRILARCCTEPHLRRYYLCLLAYRGVVTWQDFKSLHRESAALTGVPCALVTCLLDYIQEMEHRFGTELAALAPPPPPPAAQTRHSDAWLPAWLPAALQWIGETACGIYGGLTAHQPEHTSGGDIELHKHERLRVKKLE